MRKFYVNIAKSYVGRNVNLHLKDHSVIINVLLTGLQGNRRNLKLYYRTPDGRSDVSIKDVDWVEPLNPLFNVWGDERV